MNCQNSTLYSFGNVCKECKDRKFTVEKVLRLWDGTWIPSSKLDNSAHADSMKKVGPFEGISPGSATVQKTETNPENFTHYPRYCKGGLGARWTLSFTAPHTQVNLTT